MNPEITPTSSLSPYNVESGTIRTGSAPLSSRESVIVDTALSKLGFKEIARGKEKRVCKWVSPGVPPNPFSSMGNKVYYIAVKSFFSSAAKRLKSEMKTIKRIRHKLSSQRRQELHLALDIKEIEKGIEGKYTVEAPLAQKGDFEDVIRGKREPLPLKDRIHLTGQYLKGLKNLHQADYAFGDIKPENCLVYEENGKSVLRIADFGKAREVADKTKIYQGNTRFAPPERTLSKVGDVYGGALVMIRSLEEQYLDKNGEPLTPIDQNDKGQAARMFASVGQRKRGVERLILQHKHFLGDHFITFRGRAPKLNPKTEAKQQKILRNYVDTLCQKITSDVQKKQKGGDDTFHHMRINTILQDYQERFEDAGVWKEVSELVADFREGRISLDKATETIEGMKKKMTDKQLSDLLTNLTLIGESLEQEALHKATQAVGELKELLQQMLSRKPRDRPTMAGASERYATIEQRLVAVFK